MIVACAVLLLPPWVAVTVRVRVVRCELGVTVTVSVDCPVPWRVVGLSTGLIPVAPPLTVKETRDVTVPPTVTVYVVEALPEMGRFTVRELGETLTVKLPDMTTREADVE